MQLSFRSATESDISPIMEIEASSFEPGICEKKSIFLERIHTFPDGFILLCDSNNVIGYLCAEIWNNLSIGTNNTSDTGNLSGTGKPTGTDNTFDTSSTFDATLFTLGHSAAARHVSNGSVLYISSTGILPSYRGLGLGKQLFNTSVSRLCEHYSSITTLVLLVNEKWLPARKVYTAAGFTECSRLNGFFTPDECERQDGIVMIKKAQKPNCIGSVTNNLEELNCDR